MCFDWLFNLQVPHSTDRVVIMRPASKTFTTGLARAYEEDYDYDRLQKYLSVKDFSLIMERLNDKLDSSFPCELCWVFGYLCCPFTFGLSLLCPAQCVNNAERHLRQAIWRTNQRELMNKNIEIALVK